LQVAGKTFTRAKVPRSSGDLTRPWKGCSTRHHARATLNIPHPLQAPDESQSWKIVRAVNGSVRHETRKEDSRTYTQRGKSGASADRGLQEFAHLEARGFYIKESLDSLLFTREAASMAGPCGRYSSVPAKFRALAEQATVDSVIESEACHLTAEIKPAMMQAAMSGLHGSFKYLNNSLQQFSPPGGM
jgi:hypothetical protein